MDLAEEKPGRKGDREDEVTDADAKPGGDPRRSRKNESVRRSKKSRSNSGQNRRESSRSRSRSRSGQPSNAGSKKSWKSANAWLNFMQDFRESLRAIPVLRKANIFRLAGEQWSEMSPEEKKPYIDAANKIKRMRQQDSDTESKKKSRTRASRGSKSDGAPKVEVQKKRGKAAKRKNPPPKKVEGSESESDSEVEDSAIILESDYVSVDTDSEADDYAKPMESDTTSSA